MLQIYNTLSARLEKFEALENGKVKIYLCGPTVYDNAHLGHGRSAIAFDLIRRYLIYKNYSVTFVSNYTDIDDKMISRAQEEGITVQQLANKIIPEYEKDYSDLKILKADKQPKATEHIPRMIEMVEALIKKGIAYEISDGIYFDITMFPEYGKLSKQKLDELQAGKRVDLKDEKRNPQDFVLWKKSKQGEPFWESPWGHGRPGWHIECSAMNMDIFGKNFDIHGGGLDLIFPHHECEIAQSEAVNNCRFVKYWMHNGFVRVDNEKMSKSLGNFFTLKDIFKSYDPLVVRYLLISQHYRNPIDFSDEVLNQAKNTMQRLQDFLFRLDNEQNLSQQSLNEIDTLINSYKLNFEKYMDNDFDSSGALGVIFEFVKEINRLLDESELSHEDLEKIKIFINQLNSVLGILEIKTEEIPEEILQLIKDRENHRKEKNWTKSDEIRNIIKEKGYDIEDSSSGIKCRKI